MALVEAEDPTTGSTTITELSLEAGAEALEVTGLHCLNEEETSSREAFKTDLRMASTSPTVSTTNLTADQSGPAGKNTVSGGLTI